MEQPVVNGALCKCSFGTMPSALTVLPTNCTMICSQPAASIMDHIPFVNIIPFTMCSSPTNPAVITATAAALGVLTPMPCTPVTPAPWVGGSSMLIHNQPALTNSSTLMCTYAGVISITFPGTATVNIP